MIRKGCLIMVFMCLNIFQFSSNILLAQTSPNILWIITDDQRADALACYNKATTGKTNSSLGYVESPNIDMLADEGVLFVNSYCNSPGCAPSRGSMHTGMYPHHSGIYGFEQTHNQADICKKTVPEILNSEGYQTAHFGKSGYYIFEWGPGLTWNSLGFYEYSIDNKNQLQRNGLTDYYKEAVWQNGEKIGTRENFYYPDGVVKSFFIERKDGLLQSDLDAKIQMDEERDILRAYTRSLDLLIIGGESSMGGDKTLDAYTTKALKKYLEGVDTDFTDLLNKTTAGPVSSQPLFIHLGYHFPHTPVLPPKSFRDRFKNKKYNLPEFDETEVDKLPPQLQELYEKMQIADMTYNEKQQAIRDYYAFCAYGDSLIGESVKAFKNYCESNEQEYLIILASGDHSWHLGEQGIEAKFGPYDMSNHTATIVVSSDKNKFPAGQVNEAFVEYVDFAPTMLSAAGIDVGTSEYEYLDGFDMTKVVDGTLPAREYVLGEMNHVYGPRAYIRTKDFAFSMRVREKNNRPSNTYLPNNNIQWALTTSRENAEMALYDLRLDSKERNNVAYTTEYQDLSDWFRRKLGNIVLGDGRVEVIWSEKNNYDVSNFAMGSDNKHLDIPEEIIPGIQDYSTVKFQVFKKKSDSITYTENAKITIDSLVFITDSTGIAQGEIRHGIYLCNFEAEGCRPLEKTIEISPGNISFRDTLLIDSYNIRVSIVDSESKMPVDSAFIELGNFYQKSNMQGHVEFDEINYGNYPLSVNAAHYYTYSIDDFFIASDSVIEILLEPRYYDQRIRLLNQWDQTPVKYLEIFIQGEGFITNNLGDCQTRLKYGQYLMTISEKQKRYQQMNQTIEIFSDSIHAFFIHQLLADVKFRIYSGDAPVIGASILINNIDTLTTNMVGVTSVNDLNTDFLYDYKVQKDGYEPYTDQFVVQSDSTVEILLQPVNSNEMIEMKGLYIYPNPARDKIVISCPVVPYAFNINDLTGRALIVSEVSSNEEFVDISHLSEGIYILVFPQLNCSLLLERKK